MTNHLTETQFINYIYQLLPDAEREALDLHLSTCSSCRTYLADYETIQRRVHYSVAARRRVNPSSKMSYAAIAPRLKRSGGLMTIVKQSSQVAYAGLTMALLVAVGIGLYFFVSNLSRPTPTTPEEVKLLTPLPTVVSQPEVKATAETNPPAVEPGAAGELKWKFNAGGNCFSLAVAGGLVYVGSPNRNFYALDSQTGQEKWRFATGGPVDSVAAVTAGVVYFGSNDGYLYTLDSQTGQEKWKFKTGLAVDSSPLVADELVYFGSWDRYFYALDAQTGQERWRFKTGDRLQDTRPTIADGLVYFGSYDGYFYALDAQTGQERWKFEVFPKSLSHFPAQVVEGIIYLGSREHLYALDSRTGQEKWQVKMPDEVVSSNMIAEGVVYVYGSKYLSALDSQTGQEKWRVQLSNPIPTLAGGVLYVGSDDFYLYALDSQTGQELWKFKTQGGIESFPTVADDRVYFTSRDNYVYAVWVGEPASK